MVEALSYIHLEGFMHRDIKPSNIYLTSNGIVKIGDYSISRKTHNQSVGAMIS
jgi:serine/threonine protein kinase